MTSIEDIRLEDIQDILRPFGITRCYKGCKHASYAIYLAVTNDTRLEAVVKEIYMDVASHFGCSYYSVERNIRTVAARAWNVNPDLLREMAGYPIDDTHTKNAPVTASEFVEIIASYILRSSKPQHTSVLRAEALR